MLGTRRFYRSRTNRMLGGVAGGIADYTGIDPTIVRIALIVALFLAHVVTFALYVAAWLLVPEQPLY